MAIAGHYLEIIDDESNRVVGESGGHDYEGWIDVTGWDWDVTDQSSVDSSSKKSAKGDTHGKHQKGTGGETGIEPALMKFTKLTDFSSIRLIAMLEARTKIQTARFVLREEVVPGSVRHPFELEVILSNAYVVSYELSARASEYRVDLEESLELHYANIEFLYTSARGVMPVDFDRKAASTKGSTEKDAPDMQAMIKGMIDDAAAKEKRIKR